MGDMFEFPRLDFINRGLEGCIYYSLWIGRLRTDHCVVCNCNSKLFQLKTHNKSQIFVNADE